MYLRDPLVELPRPSAEDPPVEFLRSGAGNPLLDLLRSCFCLDTERVKCHEFQFVAQHYENNLSRARKLHGRINCARARNLVFFSIQNGEISALGRGNSTGGSTAPGLETENLLYIKRRLPLAIFFFRT